MTTYSRSDLIAEVADQTGQTKAQTETVVRAVFDTITRRAADGKVSLKGFGIFETRQRAERNGRNPRTGEEVRIGASSRLAFRPARRPA